MIKTGKVKQNYDLPKLRIALPILTAFFLWMTASQLQAQYKIRHEKEHYPQLTFGSEKNNGFRVTLSLVAMFTSGVADRSGFRLGTGIQISQRVDNWEFSTGCDFYKDTGNFGLGTTFAGVGFDTGKLGGSYYVNKYHRGDKQVSGIINVHLDDFFIRFEDDILAYPFTGFKIYDRYRTAALEVRYKRFLIGTNVYTTDINGVTDVSSNNSKGMYATGKQISGPVYIGYTYRDLMVRYGLNDRLGGWLGQNVWHENIFDTPNFQYGDYRNHFLQIGVDKPYTLF